MNDRGSGSKLKPWISKWEYERVRRRRSLWRRLTPPQLFLGSFVLLIVLGTLGLKTLPGLYTGRPLGWLEALFTATSAVCVTGLIVVDTATFFTPAGQGLILLLIQLGGLGIITFTTLLIAAMGRRLSLRHESLTAIVAEVAPHVDYRRLARDVVGFTLGIEAAGTLVLYALWIPRLGWREALWPAAFHAVSAFCNAGFSTFSDSLVGFQQSTPTLLVIMALIVSGGIGFLTLEELHLRRKARRKGRRYRISLHSRLVLVTTAILLVVGWVLALVLEWEATLGEMPAWSRVVNALFISVTARTAGFNSIDYARATEGTNFLTIILMTVGGSPGSTAGGLKTTTVALLGLLAWSRFRGVEVTSLWGRSIPEETIQRAVGLAVASFLLMVGSLFILTISESTVTTRGEGRGDFLGYLFEAVSAFNTVGLSMGVTGGLSDVGKWTAIQLMFLGRVGLPTTAAALTLVAPTPAGEFRFAYEDVMVG